MCFSFKCLRFEFAFLNLSMIIWAKDTKFLNISSHLLMFFRRKKLSLSISTREVLDNNKKLWEVSDDFFKAVNGLLNIK